MQNDAVLSTPIGTDREQAPWIPSASTPVGTDRHAFIKHALDNRGASRNLTVINGALQIAPLITVRFLEAPRSSRARLLIAR